MTNVVEIEGVGEAYAEKLGAAGVSTVESLLDAGATSHGRKEIAEKTGISEHLILKWVNHSDLFRINGVAGEYAELLEASGVDTVVELAQRNPTHLQAKMAETNEAKSSSVECRRRRKSRVGPRRQRRSPVAWSTSATGSGARASSYRLGSFRARQGGAVSR